MFQSQETQILTDPLRNSDLALGTVLRERYRLDSELGRGGMGTVYRATDLQVEREVAVKVLSADCRLSPWQSRTGRSCQIGNRQSAIGNVLNLIKKLLDTHPEEA